MIHRNVQGGKIIEFAFDLRAFLNHKAHTFKDRTDFIDGLGKNVCVADLPGHTRDGDVQRRLAFSAGLLPDLPPLKLEDLVDAAFKIVNALADKRFFLRRKGCQRRVNLGDEALLP